MISYALSSPGQELQKSGAVDMRVLVIAMLTMVECLSAYGGSLYNGSGFSSLTSDSVAHEVGDSISVIVFETSQATSNTGTSLDQSLDASGKIGKSETSEGGSLSLGLGRDSEGATSRQGKLHAQISASINEIDSFGRLYLVGTQKILVNGEEQLISVKGWARQEDVSPQNVVLSTRLSGAEIIYSGDGYLDDTNRPGFIHWILTKLGLI